MKLRSTGECTQPVALSLKWYDTSHEEQFSKAGTECVKQQLQPLVYQVLVQVIQMPQLDRNPPLPLTKVSPILLDLVMIYVLADFWLDP